MVKGLCDELNLKGIKIDASSGANIPGIYDKIEGRSLPLFVTGLNNNDNIVPDFIATSVSVAETIFYVLISVNYDGTQTFLKVESDDDVSVVTNTVSEE